MSGCEKTVHAGPPRPLFRWSLCYIRACSLLTLSVKNRPQSIAWHGSCDPTGALACQAPRQTMSWRTAALAACMDAELHQTRTTPDSRCWVYHQTRTMACHSSASVSNQQMVAYPCSDSLAPRERLLPPRTAYPRSLVMTRTATKSPRQLTVPSAVAAADVCARFYA